MLKTGDRAPDFNLLNSEGRCVALADFQGKTLVLYFYSRNNTAGCTKEAIGFKDLHEEFANRQAQIIGVSPDKHSSHQRFREKHDLPFELLSDPEREVARRYGVLGEKKMYGKVKLGIIRTTFIIDPEGQIAAVITGVKADEHPQKALDALGNLG